MVRVLTFVLLFASNVAFADTESQLCSKTINAHPKQVHLDAHCLAAAQSGVANIQYAVGMSFGYSGDSEEELHYYQLAANGGYVPAYLAIGHVFRSAPYNNEAEAMKWYEKYANSKESGYGYAALLLSDLYEKQGNTKASQHWLAICKEAKYSGCSK